MSPFEIVSVVFGTLGIIGGAIGFFSGRSASAKAEKAQTDASSALARSASATEEAAVALTRANELVESQIPRKEPRWEIRQLSRGKFLLFNGGDATAIGASVWGVGDVPGFIRSADVEPRDVMPGDSLAFTVIWAHGGRPRIRWEWDERGTEEHFDHELDIHTAI